MHTDPLIVNFTPTGMIPTREMTPVGVKCPMVWQVHEPVAAPELRSATAEAMVQA